MNNLTTSRMYVYTFYVDKKEVDTTVLRLYGLDLRNQSVCLRVSNFTPYVYIELPLNGRIKKWTRHMAQAVSRKVEELLGYIKPLDPPTLTMMKKLYAPQTDSYGRNNMFPFLFCKFSCKNDIWALKKVIRDPIHVPNIGTVNLKMHEESASQILQLTCITGIPTAGWIEFTGRLQDTATKETLAAFEYRVGYKKIKPVDLKNMIGPLLHPASPLVMSFDIEAYSHSPSKFPDALHPEDKVFMISCVFFRVGSPRTNRFLLTLGAPREEVVGCSCRCYKNEGMLIEGFASIMREMNPQIITGWNILSFDMDYLINRAQFTRSIGDFSRSGMHAFKGAGEPVTIKWSSAAYKNQEFQFLDFEGRIIVDLLPIIKRDFKFNNYKLNTVAEHFVGIGKDDMTPQQLFKAYDNGILAKDVTTKGITQLSIAGKYCMVDSDLVAKVFEKTQTWIGLTEMAQTCNVPIFYLVIKGQQVRVFSQVYRYCLKNKIVVESNGYVASANERYVGAFVFTPTPGVYDNVLPFDFASLYPTTMIAYNFDYSTLVKDDRVPDTVCNVIEWEDHQGCDHDPKVRRVKELTLFINSEVDSISKQRKHRDKLRISDFLPPGKRHSKAVRKGAKRLRERKRTEINRGLKLREQELKPYRKERAKIKTGIPKLLMCAHRKYRFLKEPKGVIPTVLQNLLDARAKTRKQIKLNKIKIKQGGLSEKEKRDINMMNSVLHQRQLSFKISCNSMYGSWGVREGYLPFMPGAMCTTAMGRRNNILAAKVIVDKHKGELIYGDSVTGDTPLLVRHPNGMVEVLTIETLSNVSNGGYRAYDGFKAGESNRREKQQAIVDMEIWTDGVWADVNRVIRHKTRKRIFRVLTHTGCVDVTEDHSLLDAAGQKLKPVDAKVGQELLHSFPTNFPGISFDVTTEEAFVMGFFFGDGSCGDYNCPSGVYKLVPTGKVRNIVQKYRCLFYDKDKKKVPVSILNASRAVRSEFVRGYRIADGSKTGPLRQDCKGKIGAQGLYYLFKSLGENVSIHTREKKNKIYRLNSTSGKFRRRPDAIKKIIDLGYNNEEDFVYDVETSQSKFLAGVGSMIIKNTDSQYLTVPHIADLGLSKSESSERLWQYAMRVAADVTKLYPSPMKLEFEEEIYHRFLILSKKRYMYRKISREGDVCAEIGNKGVLLSRRDNSDVVREMYREVVRLIFDYADVNRVLDYINDCVLDLFHGVVRVEKCIITKAIGSVGSLPLISDSEAVKAQWLNMLENFRKEGNASKVIIGNYTIPVLSCDVKERSRQLTLKCAKTQIEYYINSLPAHVTLAMKMRSRGVRVDDGCRLEHVVCGDHKAKLFQKLEDVSYQFVHSRYVRIDWLHYLKSMVVPIDQILNSCFKEKFAKNFVQMLYKSHVSKSGVMKELSQPEIKFIK
jgi:DNA polymerase elongation subunit (family B)